MWKTATKRVELPELRFPVHVATTKGEDQCSQLIKQNAITPHAYKCSVAVATLIYVLKHMIMCWSAVAHNDKSVCMRMYTYSSRDNARATRNSKLGDAHVAAGTVVCNVGDVSARPTHHRTEGGHVWRSTNHECINETIYIYI